MKTTIFKTMTLIAIYLFSMNSHAQTKEETLEWLNVKKNEVYTATSNTCGESNWAKLEITSTYIKVRSDDGCWTKFFWSEIKDIKIRHDTHIEITTSDIYEGKASFIEFNTSRTITASYFKALKHMASINGATLIKEDLFGN